MSVRRNLAAAAGTAALLLTGTPIGAGNPPPRQEREIVCMHVVVIADVSDAAAATYRVDHQHRSVITPHGGTVRRGDRSAPWCTSKGRVRVTTNVLFADGSQLIEQHPWQWARDARGGAHIIHCTDAGCDWATIA